MQFLSSPTIKIFIRTTDIPSTAPPKKSIPMPDSPQMPKQILPPTSGRAATSESGEEEIVPKGHLEQCELEKGELEGELDDINERLAHTLVSNRLLIGSLVRNYEYNIQCSVGTIDKLSEQLASLVLSSECVTPPYIQPIKAPSLADDFSNLPLKPRHPYSVRCLYTINDDIQLDAPYYSPYNH
ncbi:hypothetical protein ACEPPN_001636 [Leptodophora sp. 'Broadleaf-Isolate-01']